ncbi:hypothetical protein DFH09DRAFT_1265396 [Mycena vulgaris]|nr:hypothetical protein DFH09DRAFT_1265396 [Mycena vulgaris]
MAFLKNSPRKPRYKCSAGGLGDALAREFQSRGFRVFATSRQLPSMESLAALENVTTIALDVTNGESIRAAKDQISALTGGKLDILVNNASVASFEPYPFAVADLDMDRVKALYDVNVFGPMQMAKEFISLLLTSDDARVIQLGSLAGLMPVPFNAPYNSSKAAVHTFNDTLRVELAPFDVKVITIVSGNVKSNIMKPETLPADSIYQPIRAEYQTDRLEKFQENAMEADVWAATVVTACLKPTPKPWVWLGPNSWLVWSLSTFASRTGFMRPNMCGQDSILSNKFGIAKLARLLAAK